MDLSAFDGAAQYHLVICVKHHDKLPLAIFKLKTATLQLIRRRVQTRMRHMAQYWIHNRHASFSVDIHVLAWCLIRES